VPRIPARGAVAHGTVLARHSALDETRQRADPEGRLLPPRDDAEAGYAKDLVSFGRGNGAPPNRAPELRGSGSPGGRIRRQDVARESSSVDADTDESAVSMARRRREAFRRPSSVSSCYGSNESGPSAPEAEGRAVHDGRRVPGAFPIRRRLSALDRTPGQRVPLKRRGEQGFSRLPMPKVAGSRPVVRLAGVPANT
jgi:hypothetical protein